MEGRWRGGARAGAGDREGRGAGAERGRPERRGLFAAPVVHVRAQVDELRSRLEALPERSQTLVSLRVGGAGSRGARGAREALVAGYGERLAYLTADLGELLTRPRPEDLATLTAEGFMAAGVQRLLGGESAADTDALQLLYRLQREVSDATA